MLLVASACASSAPAAPSAAPASGVGPETISLYRGADRQKLLEEGARREGKVVWYTTSIVNQLVRPLVDDFQQKYPFVRVEYYRADSSAVSQRVVQEYQGGKYEVDIADGTGTPSLLAAADAIQPFASPSLDAYGPELKGKDGRWAAYLIYYMVLGYNTKLVTKSEVPKTYEDLLDLKWKKKMAWSNSTGSGAPTFIGNILATMGETKGMDYLRKLAAQDVASINASGRSVLDQAIAGQYPIAIQIFNDQAAFSASQGAPVAWQPLEPVYAQLSRVALAKKAPHPYASMLFLDFLLSEQGQRIVRDSGGIPAHPNVAPTAAGLRPQDGNFKANYLDPDAAFKEGPRWADLYNSLFVR